MWWLLLFLSVCHGAPIPNSFTLSVPDGPLSVSMGSSIILPCSLSPAFTVSLRVNWQRNDETPVLLYENQQVLQQHVGPQYRGRVSLIGELEKGNVSLKLENVSLADGGEFVCLVAGDKWYEQASVHLIVKAPPVIGSPPVLSVTDGGSGQVKVTCVSDGWSPQPTLTWRNNRGTEIPSHNHHSAPDAHGLVSVTSWLVHSSSDSEWVACSVGLSEEERKESRVLPYVSGIDTAQVKELEERLITTGAEVERLKQESTGPWKGLFFSFLVLFLLLSCITGFVLYRRGLMKCKDSKERAAEFQQDKLQASKGETESLVKKQSEEAELLNQKITELQSEPNESNREVKAKNQEIAELQRRLNESNREMEEKNQQIAELQSKLDISKQEETLNQQITGLEKNQSDEVKTLNLKITELQSQLNESKRKEEENNPQIAGLLKKQSEEVKTLNQKITELQSQLSNREVETNNPQIASLLKKQSEEIAELQNQLDESKREVDTLNQKIKELQSQLNESNRKVETKDQQIALLQSHLNESSRQVETKDQQIAWLLNEGNREMEAKNQQIAELQSHQNESNRQVEAQKQQIAELLSQLDKSKQEVETLKQEIKGAFSQNPALKLTWDRLKAIQESPTLDETSKQGNLRISSSGKRVNCLKPNNTSVQPHYVLCKDTFDSGQHYWEVSVADKESWFAGVCKNTLSGGTLTTQNNCWLLYYDKDKGLYVNTDPITPAQVTIPLRMLGVFLDCSVHVLTFYDAESQSYLCAFHDVTSPVPLVPVISPGVRDKHYITIS